MNLIIVKENKIKEKKMRYCYYCKKKMYSSNYSIWIKKKNYDIHKKCKEELLHKLLKENE